MNDTMPGTSSPRHPVSAGNAAPAGTMRILLLALSLACAALAWLLPGTASAQTCWMTASPQPNFGTVGPGGATTSSTMAFTCNNYSKVKINFRVCLFMNPNTPTGVAPRWMVLWNPGKYLSYDLYAGPSYTQIVGSETSGHPVYSTTLTMASDGQATGSMPLYARMPAGQTSAAGNYVSQITSVLRVAWDTGNTVPTDAQCAASQTASTNYTEVRAQFANSCYISTATDLDFGTVSSVASGNRDQGSAISLHCPAGTAWRVGLDYGANAQGSQRRMAGPGGYIGYQLYQDSGRSQPWGPTSASDQTGTGNNTTQTLPVYGRVPAQPTVPPGTYSDTVTVTLTY